MEQHGVQICRDARCLLDGILAHAAEKKSRRLRTAAGQVRPVAGWAAHLAHPHQGPAPDVQSRPAGGQAADLRQFRPDRPVRGRAGRDRRGPDGEPRALRGRTVADPALLATDLADYLVRRGVPFREAHHAVGRAVALAESHSVPLNQLPTAEIRQLHPGFGPDWMEVFDLARALANRRGTGMPGPAQVRKQQLARWKKLLQG